MIKIDIDTRCWQIPREEAFLGVESDDKVRILQFELSKNEFCNGLNFTDCNCFINYKNNGNDTISYGITDMAVQEDGTVTFTWEVSRGATIFKGNTFAILCAKKVHDDGTIMNEWNSRIGTFTVAKGIEPLSSITEVPEIDIISQLLLVAKQTNENAQTNINQSSSLLEKAEGLAEGIGYLKKDVDKLKGDLELLTHNVWNAVEHGCDKMNDCSPTLNYAIENEPDGTVFYFPKGRYLFNSQIIIRNKKNITICGDNPGWSNSGTVFQTSYPYSFMIIYGGDGLRINNIRFYNSTPATSSTAIYFNDDTPTTDDCRVTNSEVQDIVINGFARGISLNAPSGYNVFKNVSIGNFSDVVENYGIIIGENFKNTYKGENVVLPNYIYIDGCKIDALGKEKNTYGISINVGYFIFVSNNDICNIKSGSAIKVLNINNVSKVVNHLNVSNNALYNNMYGIQLFSANENKTVGYINISNNFFDDFIDAVSDTYGIFLNKTDVGMGNFINVSIIGNIMRKHSADDITFTPLSGSDFIDQESKCVIGIGM